MNAIPDLNDRQKKALLEGIRKLCDLFRGPDSTTCKTMLSDAYYRPFEEISTFIDYDPPDFIRNIKLITHNHTDAASLFSSLEAVYVRLFISDRSGIVAPLYESCYEFENAPLMGAPAIRMIKRLESKGLSLAPNIHEPPDHISVELEYLYFLLEKCWSDDDQTLVDETASFAAAIMLPWIKKLQERLSAAETECRFFLLITVMLCAMLQFIGITKPAS